LTSSAADLFHFLIVFSSVFFTFMSFGMVLFGKEVDGFATLPRALLTCFSIMFGEINWPDLRVIGRTEAQTWLTLFIVTIPLIMVNMILAIIMNHYERVKNSTGYKETIVDEAWKVFKRWRHPEEHVVPGHVLDRLLRGPMHRQGPLQNVLNHSRTNFLSTTVLRSILKTSTKNVEDEDTEKEETEEPPSDVSEDSGISFDESPEPKRRSNESLRSEVEDVKLITIAELMKIANVSEEQALEIISSAVVDYHEMHKHNAELEELLVLTQKCEARARQGVQLAQEAVQVRRELTISQTRQFGDELSLHLQEVTSVLDERYQELQRLEATNQHLQSLLLKLPPSAVFPVASSGPQPSPRS